eukprot:1464430-Pyramimonas_sp.AAC.1
MEDIPHIAGHVGRTPYAGMPTDAPISPAAIPTLSDFQWSCRQARRSAPGCDGIPGGLVRACPAA